MFSEVEVGGGCEGSRDSDYLQLGQSRAIENTRRSTRAAGSVTLENMTNW